MRDPSVLSICTPTTFTARHPIASSGITSAGGNDTLSITGYEGPSNLCGSTGDDRLIGCHEFQYLSGGSGNDGLDGAASTDTVRGGDGNDVLAHTASGTDWLRGENQDDCFELSRLSYSSTTTCSSGADSFSYSVSNCREQGSCAPQPASCETEIIDCCSLAGRVCPR